MVAQPLVLGEPGRSPTEISDLRHMMRILLILLLLIVSLPCALAQDANPFGATDDKANTKAEWTATHPDGDAPHERMLSLAHTDALPSFDRVELYAVSLPKRDPFSDEKPEPKPGGKTFPVRPYGAQATIHAHVSLTGADCNELRTAWQSLAFDRLGGAFCHYPAYGFRLYRSDLLLFETTVCWQCQNFYVPRFDADKKRYTHGWYGFANDAKAKALLKLFRSHLPHPKL
ncbi:hypothetical protein CA13_08950 [Planctomycetes bacterium CA13]|uniref:Uncharacterized protein n=2 Tax=Novipirellula herctigrandis TaxID=2527986 RepID=A0A5C5YYC8_9BACT|nr:hypothetical protein CA13_08950 [Planctomycetes bacterium CA13]